ncbi:hypothetical protein L218DRAFT_965272 [Marasmius fiardii PR-910]|nr:hypothetical protein L218DRAFT_965272 [Marasmius fiardii PR-910]
MDSLPHEILLTIFEFTSDIERPNDTFLLKSGDDSKPIYYSPHAQETISHVCRKWRSVALRASSLWSTLHFNKVTDIPRAEEYCKRAPRSYLDILILCVSEEEYNKPGKCLLWENELEHIFTILAPHTPRWRSFHLQVRDGRCKKVARKYIGTQVGDLCGPAPNLQTWQLYHFEDYQREEDLVEATFRRPVECFRNDIPNLKHLSLIGVNLPWASPYLKNLHSLELCLHPDNIRPDYEHWQNMLLRSPELKSLFLHYSGPKLRGAPWLHEPAIDLPKLEYLGLVDIESDYLEAITAKLQFANVKKLELELGDTDDETPSLYDNWIASISDPTPRFRSLTSLTLTTLQCSDPALKLLFGTLIELRELEMKYAIWWNVWPMFVDDLKWKEVTGSDGIATEVSAGTRDDRLPLLLPKLEVLKVRGTIDESSDRRCNVKLILRFREREGSNTRHESPAPNSTSDRPVFTIVGTLPVQVLPPVGISDRTRQTNVLRRLVRLRAPDCPTADHSQDSDINMNWKVLVDVEDITEGDEDDVDDDDEVFDSEDEEENYEDED